MALDLSIFGDLVRRNAGILVVGIVVLSITILSQYLRLEHDPREPSVIPQKVPYVGHLIGMIQHGMKYIEATSKEHRLPIYTLDILNSKTYVVNSPELVVAVQKATKTLSFNPFIVEVFKRMVGMDTETVEIIRHNMDNELGGSSYMSDMHRVEYASLAPGPDLDKMNLAVLNRMALLINRLGQTRESVKLYEWIRHLFTKCSTYAVYGPASPFESRPELEKSFWDFETDLKILLLDVWPSITARRGHQGREIVGEAFKHYYRSDGHHQASKVVQERFTAATKHGLTLDQIAPLDVGLLFGVLVNVVPTSFWLICYICSNPTLLSEIREEIADIVSKTETGNRAGENAILKVNRFKQTCPLLVSTYQEVLRLIASASSGRAALQDTVINDRYLLKKGAVIQMAAGVIHHDPDVWGQDADEFKPRRFLKTQSAEKQHPGAFRAFGGGANLCPGRHFAFTEILSLVAVLLAGFDIAPVSGTWVLPEQDYTRMSLGVSKPASDVEVLMKPRPGFRHVKWQFSTADEEAEA